MQNYYWQPADLDLPVPETPITKQDIKNVLVRYSLKAIVHQRGYKLCWAYIPNFEQQPCQGYYFTLALQCLKTKTIFRDLIFFPLDRDPSDILVPMLEFYKYRMDNYWKDCEGQTSASLVTVKYGYL